MNQNAPPTARSRIRSIGSEDREFRNLPRRQGNDLLGLRGGLHDQGNAQIFFQEMLARGKARGGHDIIGQSWNTQNDGIGGFFGAEPGAARHTALAKCARQAQNASQGAVR